MTMRWGLVAGAAVIALLAGCGAEDGSAPAGTPIPTSTASESSASSAPGDVSRGDIDAARLPPCPASNPTIAAVPNGLPDLTLACLGRGPEVRLAGLRGKPMVVNVWASWCAPCRRELPALGQVNAAAAGSVLFLGIDLADDRLAGLRLAASTQMGFASVVDPDSKVRAGLRVVGVPTTLFVRADGTIAGRTGVIPDAQSLRQAIDQYLNVRVP